MKKSIIKKILVFALLFAQGATVLCMKNNQKEIGGARGEIKKFVQMTIQGLQAKQFEKLLLALKKDPKDSSKRAPLDILLEILIVRYKFKLALVADFLLEESKFNNHCAVYESTFSFNAYLSTIIEQEKKLQKEASCLSQNKSDAMRDVLTCFENKTTKQQQQQRLISYSDGVLLYTLRYTGLKKALSLTKDLYDLFLKEKIILDAEQEVFFCLCNETKENKSLSRLFDLIDASYDYLLESKKRKSSFLANILISHITTVEEVLEKYEPEFQNKPDYINIINQIANFKKFYYVFIDTPFEKVFYSSVLCNGPVFSKNDFCLLSRIFFIANNCLTKDFDYSQKNIQFLETMVNALRFDPRNHSIKVSDDSLDCKEYMQKLKDSLYEEEKQIRELKECYTSEKNIFDAILVDSHKDSCIVNKENEFVYMHFKYNHGDYNSTKTIFNKITKKNLKLLRDGYQSDVEKIKKYDPCCYHLFFNQEVWEGANVFTKEGKPCFECALSIGNLFLTRLEATMVLRQGLEEKIKKKIKALEEKNKKESQLKKKEDALKQTQEIEKKLQEMKLKNNDNLNDLQISEIKGTKPKNTRIHKEKKVEEKETGKHFAGEILAENVKELSGTHQRILRYKKTESLLLLKLNETFQPLTKFDFNKINKYYKQKPIEENGIHFFHSSLETYFFYGHVIRGVTNKNWEEKIKAAHINKKDVDFNDLIINVDFDDERDIVLIPCWLLTSKERFNNFDSITSENDITKKRLQGDCKGVLVIFFNKKGECTHRCFHQYLSSVVFNNDLNNFK